MFVVKIGFLTLKLASLLRVLRDIQLEKDEANDTGSRSSKKRWYTLQASHLSNGVKFVSVLACSIAALVYESCLCKAERSCNKTWATSPKERPPRASCCELVSESSYNTGSKDRLNWACMPKFKHGVRYIMQQRVSIPRMNGGNAFDQKSGSGP